MPKEWSVSEYLPKHLRNGKGHTEATRDEMETIAYRAWHRQGRVIVKPDELKETDWVLAQSAIEYAERRWGKRRL